MIRKCKSTFFLMIISILSLMGQQESNRFSFSGSEIVVDFLPENDMYFSQVIDTDVTIYNLAEYFQVSKEQLFKVNHLDPKKPVKVGKVVKVTLDKQKVNAKVSEQNKYLSLKYRVKKGDTFFKIQQMAGVDQQTLLRINAKKSTSLLLGELLLVGYYPKAKNSKTKKDISHPETAKEKDVENKDKDLITKYYLSDVIGSFDKSTLGNGQYYVLHNEARTGSMIDIYNPMLKKHIKAKVIGKIPDGTYQNDIKIIINKSAAMALNILDARFKVNIKYEQ